MREERGSRHCTCKTVRALSEGIMTYKGARGRVKQETMRGSGE